MSIHCRILALVTSLALGVLLCACEQDLKPRQSAADLLKHSGLAVAEALQTYRATHGKWPEKLEDLVTSGLLKDQRAVLYPVQDKLTTPKDGQPADQVEWKPWIYHRPPANSVDTPLLVAPHGFSEMDGMKMERTQRLVIKVGTPPQQINEDDLVALEQMLLPQ